MKLLCVYWCIESYLADLCSLLLAMLLPNSNTCGRLQTAGRPYNHGRAISLPRAGHCPRPVPLLHRDVQALASTTAYAASSVLAEGSSPRSTKSAHSRYGPKPRSRVRRHTGSSGSSFCSNVLNKTRTGGKRHNNKDSNSRHELDSSSSTTNNTGARRFNAAAHNPAGATLPKQSSQSPSTKASGTNRMFTIQGADCDM